MKKVYILAFIIAIVASSCKPTKYADLPDGLYADMETNKGDILLKLTFDKTPITVANFVSLANGTNDFVVDSLKGKPFYNGTIFHRVIENFMIQGGDPLGTGSGSPGYKFKDEFPKNNGDSLILTHATPGILSMANAGPDTNGSQFFITHKETPWLDYKHTVFGNVEIGQNVVDSIVKNDTIKSIEIIKIGKIAKAFKASEVFSNHYSKYLLNKREKEAIKELVVKNTLTKFKENLAKAIELPSGLKYVITNTKNGKRPKNGVKVKLNYAGYFDNGNIFDTNDEEVAKKHGIYNENRAINNGYSPLITTYGPEARLITGFREGLQKMKLGDAALLFIPSHLGYGSQGAGGVIPPNSNLVFEVELLELVK